MEHQSGSYSDEINLFLNLLAEEGKHHSLRAGIDYYDDRLWYGMAVGDKRFFVTSGVKIIPATKLPKGFTASEIRLDSPLSQEGLHRYIAKEQVDGGRLLSDLEVFFRSHAIYQFDATPSVLAHWVLGTYLYMAFPTYPYIWINSATKQSGKTRVLELIAAVGFRNPGISVSLTQAVLYRSVDQVGHVLIVDEFEQAKDDTKKAMIEIFNSGFKAGAIVQRCNSDLELETFNAYSPKVFAGLNDVPDTLASRSIQIRMLPKKKKDKIQPFSPIKMATSLQRFRDDMAIWALNHAKQCADLALQPTELALPDCLDDRAADFMAPLYAISKVAKTDRSAMDEFCTTLAKARHVDTADTTAVKVLIALRDWFPKGEETEKIHLETVASLVGAGMSSLNAGDTLRKLGFEVKQIRIGDQNKKGVEIKRADLGLLERLK